MGIRRKKRKKNYQDGGYYTVEAAVFLPLLLLGVMTLSYLMTVAGMRGSVLHASVDEAHKLSAHSYVLKTDLQLRYDLPKRVKETNDDIYRANVTDMAYLYADGEEEDLIYFCLTAHASLPLPFALGEDIVLKAPILCRAWTGRGPVADPLGFAVMEENGDSTTVYVFPQTGTHYHGAGCTFVANEPVQTILSDSVQRSHRPCDSCGAKEAEAGQPVYLYEASGEVYHTGDCRYVEKYVVAIEEQEALAEGYVPCSKCGGK